MKARRLLGLVALVLAFSACADEEPQEFTADTRSGFLAACTDPLTDSRLTSSICQCVFDETQTQLSFDRFEQIDELLLLDPEAELPEELVDIIAECVMEAARL